MKNAGFSLRTGKEQGSMIFIRSIFHQNFTASGEVYNKETDQKIDGAQIRVIGTDGTNMKVRANGGRFQMKLNPGVEYFLQPSRTDF
jgi:hypothetical protein